MANLHSESEKANLDPNNLSHQQFPAGLRILVIDDDANTLKIIEQMCIQCHYNVTTCTEVHVAMNILMERKDSFDVVLSDIHMPDVQDYSFFQHVDQEFNLPIVIMLSKEDSRESIGHLACHCLVKPIGEEDLRNIWQHVFKKNLETQDNKQLEGADNTNDSDEGGILKEGKKREAGDGAESSDCTIRIKKPRVVWTKELHGLFMNAIIHLGPDRAVPKKILDFMNLPYLTRENVASHLQKYRLHLNKKDEEEQGTSSKMQGASSSGRRPHNRAMPHDDDHVSPERGVNCPGIMSKEDQIALLKSSSMMQHHHSQFHAQQPFDTMPKYDPNSIAKNIPHQPHLMAVHDDASSSGSLPPSAIGSSVGPVQNNDDMLKSIYHQMMLQQYQQQKQQQQQYQQLQQAMMNHHIHSSDSIHNIQQQPCLVGPSSQKPLETTPAAAFLNHNHYTFGARNHHPLVEHYSSSSTFLPPPIINNTSLMNIAAEFPHGGENNNAKARDLLRGYASASSVSPPPPPLGFSSSTIFQQHLVQNSTRLPFVGGGAVVRPIQEGVSVSPIPAAATQLVPYGGSNSRSSIDSSLNHNQGELVSRERQSHSNILKARSGEEEPETHLFIVNNTHEEDHSL